MLVLIKKVLFTITLNSGLLLLLLIGIQNSAKSSKVKFILGETAQLPISFIIGFSFISGSISGSVLTTIMETRKK